MKCAHKLFNIFSFPVLKINKYKYTLGNVDSYTSISQVKINDIYNKTHIKSVSAFFSEKWPFPKIYFGK